MPLERLETRPQLQFRDDVIAVGFAGDRVSGDEALSLVEEQLPTYVRAATRGAPPRFVVLDLRNVETLSSVAIGKMAAIGNSGRAAGWTVVPVVNPALRDLFAFTRLAPIFPVVGDEAELRRLVETVPAPSGTSCKGLTPELLDWARRQSSDEEIAAGLRELRNGGGLELADFLAELEQEAARRD
jgi:anti-anti-sigma regulatory factor